MQRATICDMGAAQGMSSQHLHDISTKGLPGWLLTGDMAVQFPATKVNDKLADDLKRISSVDMCLNITLGHERLLLLSGKDKTTRHHLGVIDCPCMTKDQQACKGKSKAH